MDELRDRLFAMTLTLAGATAWIAMSASSWGHSVLHLLGVQHGF
jgi:hypothetical protein